MTGTLLAVVAAALYIAGAWRQWQTARGAAPSARGQLLSLTGAGALFHLASLSFTFITPQGPNLAMFQVGSLISLVVVLLLLFSAWKKPVDNLFIGLVPMAAVIALIAASVDHHVFISNVSYALVWHILLSILAFSLFTIASVQAILVMLQDQQLRQHKTRGLLRSLPPLQTMDALLFEMIWLGIILLGAAFAIGWPVVVDLKAQHLVHKVAFATIGWAVFATLLFGRYRFGWRGPVAGKWTITGTAFLILAYFGSQFVLEYILAR